MSDATDEARSERIPQTEQIDDPTQDGPFDTGHRRSVISR
jgi:hypothetical protein